MNIKSCCQANRLNSIHLFIRLPFQMLFCTSHPWILEGIMPYHLKQKKKLNQISAHKLRHI